MASTSCDPEYISKLKLEYKKLMEEGSSIERLDPGDLSELKHAFRKLMDESPASIERISIKAGGHYGTYKFVNTCVLDSLLVVLCFCIKNDCIWHLFLTDHTISAVIKFLCTGRHNQAKALWLIQLNLLQQPCKFNLCEEVDVWSEVEDHLPIFTDMICAKYDFDDDRRSHEISSELHQRTLRAFEFLGDVKLLGLSYANPCCALIYINGRGDRAPPLFIKDGNYRTFELQFILLSRTNEPVPHMVGCFQQDDGWYLYDNNPEKPPFTMFDFEHADFTNEYVIHLAGYVNMAPAAERREDIYEEVLRGKEGTRPFKSPLKEKKD